MRRLMHVPPTHIDRAWKDGAHMLSKACETSGGEITADQLKMLLSRGERTLFAVMDGEKPVGWLVSRIDQLPNIRVMHVCELYAPNATFAECIEQFQQYARDNGCSELRCVAKPAQERLYMTRFGFEPIYTTLRVVL